MLISLFGAAREVTGSCYRLSTRRANILIDCGIFQGSTLAHSKNFELLGFDPKSLDAVFVTHAHLDHTGRLPLLVKNGFKGPIYLTPPTAKLTQLVLEDAEEVMHDERERSYQPVLYGHKDVERTVSQMKTVDVGGALCLKGLEVTFRNAGHIFGSAFLCIKEQSGPTVVFSGDLGNVTTPLLQPKEALCSADALFIESTYGNRLHENEKIRSQLLKQTVVDTIRHNGVLLIPAFAIERTQEILFELNHFVEHRLIPPVDVYMDSPMAIRASAIFDHFPAYYSREALRLISIGDELFEFPGLKKTLTRDESKTINEAPRPKIIIAGSGMMNGGRILHHMVRYLGDKNSTVLIIGFQARGTLGHKLYAGEKRVTVLNEMIDVRAKIVSIGAFSAHADQGMLLDWIKSAPTPPKRVFCVHGEEGTCIALATRIGEEFHIKADAPHFNETLEV